MNDGNFLLLKFCSLPPSSLPTPFLSLSLSLPYSLPLCLHASPYSLFLSLSISQFLSLSFPSPLSLSLSA